jgi:hypothetical protein
MEQGIGESQLWLLLLYLGRLQMQEHFVSFRLVIHATSLDSHAI